MRRAARQLIGPIGTWIVCATLVGTSACQNPSGPERELSGKRIYDRNCARCHGVDGKPTAESPSARDLRNQSYIDSLSDAAIRRAIEGGKPPAMPAFGGQFMEPSMKLLVAYVRELSRAGEPGAPAAKAN